MKPVRTEERVSFAQQVASADVSLFEHIPSQTEIEDRISLLWLLDAATRRFGTISYLEIGSHLGGSLQVVIADARVESIVSIDSRPEFALDSRGKRIPYRGNSTERMLATLRTVPGAALDKLRVIDADTRDLGEGAVTERPNFLFIDGEHTRASSAADARFCMNVMSSEGVIVFHDVAIVFTGIRDILVELAEAGRSFRAYPLPAKLFVLEFESALNDDKLIRQAAAQPGPFLYPTRVLVRFAGSWWQRPLLMLWLSPFGAGGQLSRSHVQTMVRKVLRSKVRRGRKVFKRIRAKFLRGRHLVAKRVSRTRRRILRRLRRIRGANSRRHAS